MRFSSAAVLASFVAVGSAQAQGGGASAPNAACTGFSADACQQAVDYFQYMAPQLGTAVTGGNTTMAQGGNLGTRLSFMPKIAIGVRVNGVLGNAPKFSPTAQGAAATAPQGQLTTSTAAIPMPSVDVAAGVFKGVPLGLTTVGGVDLIASVAYLPEYNGDEFSVKPKSSTAVGFGARVGLLQEGLTVPGVGFSFVSRKLPVTTLSSTQSGSSFTVSELDVKSTAWRLTVSKSLLIVGLAAGIGKDKYSNSIKDIQATMSGGPTLATGAIKSEVTRTNMFLDASMNLLILKLVATVGQVSGGDVKTWNGYDNPGNKSRLYASGGVRIGF